MKMLKIYLGIHRSLNEWFLAPAKKDCFILSFNCFTFHSTIENCFYDAEISNEILFSIIVIVVKSQPKTDVYDIPQHIFQ